MRIKVSKIEKTNPSLILGKKTFIKETKTRGKKARNPNDKSIWKEFTVAELMEAVYSMHSNKRLTPKETLEYIHKGFNRYDLDIKSIYNGGSSLRKYGLLTKHDKTACLERHVYSRNIRKGAITNNSILLVG